MRVFHAPFVYAPTDVRQRTEKMAAHDVRLPITSSANRVSSAMRWRTVAPWHMQTLTAGVWRCLTNRPAGASCRSSSSWRVLQTALLLQIIKRFTVFHQGEQTWMCARLHPHYMLDSTLPETPGAKLFSALYLTSHSMPQTPQSCSNSRCLVIVGLPEMWKSIMGDSSFGLSPGEGKGAGKKG